MSSVHYLDVAETLLKHAQNVPRPELQPIIEIAIASLNLCLNLPKQDLAIENELRARLLLSRTLHRYTTNAESAEEVVAKAITKIQGQETYMSYKLAFNEVLSQILISVGSINAAKRVVKDSIGLCKERACSYDDWHFIFLLRSVELETSTASLRTLRQFAQERTNPHVLRIADILDCVLHITHNIPAPAEICYALSTPVYNEIGKLTIEDHIHLALDILSDVMVGNIAEIADVQESMNGSSKPALSKLSIIHQELDTNKNLSPIIPIPFKSITTGMTSFVTMQGLSTRRFMILIYVLSALVHLSENTTNRCEKFLVVGENLLRQETMNPDTCPNDVWLSEMSDTICTFKSISFLLHSKLDLVAIELSQVHAEGHLKTFLQGCYEQQMGNLDAALQHYDTIPQGETKTLALLNTLLIHLGSIRRDELKVKALLLELESESMRGPLATAFRLIKSITPFTTSVALKRSLNVVLKEATAQANSQLNMLALSFLGLKSSDPDDMRLRFMSHAMGQANKSASGSAGASVWSHINGRAAEDILRTKIQGKIDPATTQHTAEKLAKLQTRNSTVEEKLHLSTPAITHVLL